MNTYGRRSFDGSASREGSDNAGDDDDDSGEATHLVPSSNSSALKWLWLPRILRLSFRHGAAIGRHVRRPPEDSTVHQARRNCCSRNLAEALVTIRVILFHSKLNAFLIIVPVAIASYLFHANQILVFAANLIAMVPLSNLLTYATEEIARGSSDVVGALVNVTFGNSVEIVIFVALYHDQLEVVQASLLGSILVNLLLILGTAILAGSFCHHELSHNKEDAQALACLLSFSVLSLIIPNAFYHSFEDTETATAAVLILSRVSSLTLLAVYLLYIFLQIRKIPRNKPVVDVVGANGLITTARTSRETSTSNALLIPRSIRFQDEEAAPSYTVKDRAQRESLEMSALGGSQGSCVDAEEANAGFELESSASDEDHEPQQQPDKSQSPRNSIYQYPPRRQRSGSRDSSQRHMNPADLQHEGHRRSFSGSTSSLPRLLLGNPVASVDNLRDVYRLEEAPPKLGILASSLLLIVSSLLVAVCAELLVDTLDDILESAPLSKTFIGLIILPVAGNCAELFTATYAAAKGNFDLAIHVAVGSSIQISLLVTPLVVIAGWVLHRNMTMYFELFGTVALFATTFLVNALILYGKSNFLEGSLLFACYFIIGVGAFLFPATNSRA